MTLIFCEKKLAAMDIAKILGVTEIKKGYIQGAEFVITWASGHLVQLALPNEYGFKDWKMSQLPILPEVFKLQCITAKNSKQPDPYAKSQLQIIGGLFKKCKSIIVATDPGREGELIFRYVYHYLKCTKPFKRLWCSSLTNTAIKKAFDNLLDGKAFDNLYYSARARSEADWMVGINATQALTLCFGGGRKITAGRVQSPTLSLIAERFIQNQNFKKESFWNIILTASTASTHDKTTIVFTSERQPVKEAATNICKEIMQIISEPLEIKTVIKKDSSENPPLLHDLASLQKKASVKYNLDMEQTLNIAQSLYEKGLITYPRTGSKHISNDTFIYVPQLLKNILNTEQYSAFKEGYNFTELNTLSVDDSKISDHHALLTTDKTNLSEINESEHQIYNLIQERMLESFAEKCKKETTNITVFCCVDFKTDGSVILSEGWRRFSGNVQPENQAEIVRLPKVATGDKLTLEKLSVKEGFTKPKPLYTDASLLTAMENCGKEIEDAEIKNGLAAGIGTPASRSGIVTKLYANKYIEKLKKAIIPTAEGLVVYKLANELPISKVELTGKWESALEEIAQGRLTHQAFDQSIRKFTTDTINKIRVLSTLN